MLSHSAIWSAIDGLADRHKLSASALARLAGLDPTSFNPSKRIKPDGRPRWPSTESIAKILKATGTSAPTFFIQGAGQCDPDGDMARSFSLTVQGDQFLPFYRHGAEILLMENPAPAVGDRVIINSAHAGFILGDVSSLQRRSISVTLLTEDNRIGTFSFSSIEWVARILWASQ